MSSVPKVEIIKVRKHVTQGNVEEIPSRDDVKMNVIQILESILLNLLPYKNEFDITATDGERTTIILIDCSQRNFSHLIGKQGKNIEALRRLTYNIFASKGFRVVIETPYYANKDD